MAIKKITVLRAYKPDGDILEFSVGDRTKEGTIERIDILAIPHRPEVYQIHYSNKSKCCITGFAVTLLEK